MRREGSGEPKAEGAGPTGPRAERKREAIVRAARSLFLREGFGVGMDAIAAEAGVSKVTVYNHFGNKEALFVAVIAGALDEPLDASSSVAALDGLTEADDLREAFLNVARAWVDVVRNDQEMTALRHLVAREIHRFPSLGEAWGQRGPEGHHPAIAGALRELAERGRLSVPDMETAVIQLYSLLVFPHLVFGSYGTDISDDLTDRLIVAGVDMFLGCYAAT